MSTVAATAKERVLQRLLQLLDLGEQVLASRYRERSANRYGFDTVNPNPYLVNRELFYRWRTSSLVLLASIGNTEVHYQEFNRLVGESHYAQAESGLGVLRAAKEDVEGGYLERYETLVSAGLFSDLLDMAQYLLENGYKSPAASLVGAVLEERLRQTCSANQITVKAKENISSLNQKLADGDVYNRLRQREIQVWNEVRDNADHGYFDKFEERDVTNMLNGVRSFLAGMP